MADLRCQRKSESAAIGSLKGEDVCGIRTQVRDLVTFHSPTNHGGSRAVSERPR